ncbi:NfeD family protein [bacterium AH-315-K05]|nr:NfeD family protein [bacterium AH-315-K05]MBN4074706.1 NfeD family protein [bacterium AH-315-E09]
MDTHTIVWAILLVVFVILEVSTLALVSIWFAVGSLAGLILSLLGFSIQLQVLAGIIISVLMLTLTIPYAKKIRRKRTMTNVESLIGKKVLLSESIEFSKPGLVTVNGVKWTAVSNKDILEINIPVIITAVDGNKLIVEKEGND